jgi:hypothetical protein
LKQSVSKRDQRPKNSKERVGKITHHQQTRKKESTAETKRGPQKKSKRGEFDEKWNHNSQKQCQQITERFVEWFSSKVL